MKSVALAGGDALSGFRLTALRQSVQDLLPDGISVGAIQAHFVYFLAVKSEWSDDLREKTCALLGARGEFEAGEGFLVTPRKGTISPWSSKATDIVHNCGLTAIQRVERGIYYEVWDDQRRALSLERLAPAANVLHDRMTEGIYTDVSDLFASMTPAPCREVDIQGQGREALARANTEMGLALSDEEIDYLFDAYRQIERNPTDVELVMFGQVNSEHCRHKIFNATWVVDGQEQARSLFGMIRHTHEQHPEGTLVAYEDNSGIIEGFPAEWFQVKRKGETRYAYEKTQLDMVMKVETHNHPTAISPFPGAATGAGGEIRDETATGIGGKSKAGLCGFMVSDLRVPGFPMPWEREYATFPDRLASPLEIMLEGPIGGAQFGNEFGRPQLCGLFRTYEEQHGGLYRGYHKPIMLAGGMGNIKRLHAHKRDIPSGSLILQLGGPAMRIGLGGGAASSMATGSNAADLDFDSVQRGNAEMERRCQEVIDACMALGDRNPILSIHDIGAGGLSNGCPELVAETGGRFFLRRVHNEDLSMSPMEIWCCEAQERYVLAVSSDALDGFLALCERERCPVAVIGEATGDGHLTLEDEHFNNKPIDIDLGVILGKPPKMLREAAHVDAPGVPLRKEGIALPEAAERVLKLPCVANKTFLITIADRSVTGLVARDQMVGPYQTPIADAAVTATGYQAHTGECMAMGERTPVALISGPASGRLAIGEALTNLAGVAIGDIGKIKLSANWMCACGEPREDMALFDTVRTVGMEMCPELGISVPVGKDSLSMRTVWEENRKQRKMTAPLSLVVSAFAPVKDVRKTVTPWLKPAESVLLAIDLGGGRNRLGASALAQVYNQVGDEAPDVEDSGLLRQFFETMQELVHLGLLLAYHDRSDGGLFACLAEMAFAGRRGLRINLDGLGDDPLEILFAEELGGVIQVHDRHLDRVYRILDKQGLSASTCELGRPTEEQVFEIQSKGESLYRASMTDLNRHWSELTYRMQSLRDNPACAREEYDLLLDDTDPGMTFHLAYDPDAAPHIQQGVRPRMAILREQGINGQIEMAAAFDRAGFESVDVHMTDLLSERLNLDSFAGLVACGGFSYGDVLGAGAGWAKSILYHPLLKEMFASFFARRDTFALGVCNGCQMISQLKDIIPGAADWPEFTRNRSEQFEARFVTVEIMRSPSVLLSGMAGSRLPIAVAHGEGFADFRGTGSLGNVLEAGQLAMSYVDNRGRTTERYPFNPNGSPNGVTGLTTRDGRVTIMMPHPERGFRAAQLSYRPADLFTGEDGPWMRMFRNARSFLG